MKYIFTILLLTVSLTVSASGRIWLGVAGADKTDDHFLQNPIGDIGVEYDVIKRDEARMSIVLEHKSGIFDAELHHGYNTLGIRFYLEYK